ncbi:MAG: UDP-glucose 4-epimerase GalE [Nocardiopsaceae bacterium]|nr:UDP-glucose 4-epimerase GalE [Nocardiopsaceae bacterium]
MKLLVTGGAGYIGGVVAAKLAEAGHEVTVLDDLSTGHADAVHPAVTLIRGSLRHDAKAALGGDTDAVLHFAAHSLVGESVADPAKYWSNNLGGTLALLNAMREAGVRRIVFSSTAAVYGEPEATPITETAPTRPTSPYGASKLAIDTTLAEYARMHGLGAVSLRYFNVAGAYQAATGDWFGERHDPETHLIPNVLGRGETRGSVRINGVDYPTPDGTCVRDYIHVSDLADAHLLALGATEPEGHRVYNLGNGAGFSVRQVIDACRDVTGRDITVEEGPRRAGDPAVLVASSARISSDLGWHATRDLRDMIADAWRFVQERSARVRAGR